MCNLLIIDSNERGAVNDMIRLIDRHFPNVILLPTVDSKSEHVLSKRLKLQ